MLWAIPSVFALQAKIKLLIRKKKTREKQDVFIARAYKKILFIVRYTRHQTLIKAIDSVGDPPLPIPNREVKPNSADGTAKICGRVGHRHFYLETLDESSGFLFSIISTCRGILCNLLYCKQSVHCV